MTERLGFLYREWTGLRISPIKVLILAVTVGLAWGALLIQREPAVAPPRAGDISPERYVATAPVEIVDEAATQAAKDNAAAGVADVYDRDESKVNEVRQLVRALFGDVRAGVAPPDGAIPPPPTTTTTTLPATTVPDDTTSAIEEGAEVPATTSSTTTTIVPEPGEVFGFLYVDADANALYNPELGDGPLQGVDVVLRASDGTTREITTDALGIYQATDVPPGPVDVWVDQDSRGFPEMFMLSTAEDPPQVEAESGQTQEFEPVGFKAVTEAPATQEARLQQQHPLLRPSTVQNLVLFATDDVVRSALHESTYLDQLEIETIQRAESVMAQEIRDASDREDQARLLYAAPRTVFFDDGTADPEAGQSVSDIVANNIQVNSFINVDATEAQQQLARDNVVPVAISYVTNEMIVDEGEPITDTQYQALVELNLLDPATAVEVIPMLLVVALAVTLLAFYLARFRPKFWSVNRRVALFGLLIVVAALAARIVAVVTPEDQPAFGYLMPAAAIGLAAAILFDARIAVLVAVAIGAVSALATDDIGHILFAGLAALVPIPFVSSISSRRDLRRAVVYSAVALAAIAAPIAWLFHGGEEAAMTVRDAAIAAFVNGLVGGLVAVAALSFLEIIFDVTTTLRLLDLTDRNHPALQLLEEKARGTFNHSLMVGTLADGAARTVGANNLLARSAAYYHDLGKTENPTFFIENQFGGFNPHNQLPPTESAQIIRQHVIDGMRLAEEYRIPRDVAEGIVTHHGDGIMRYFYHKAVERYGEENINVADYRHEGHKPRSQEMAILMLADAAEGACRAVFAEQDPSPEGITDVVERVVAEKIDDGQLSEASLTMGELTRVKSSFIEALIGNYHQRIPYPGFPRLEEGDLEALEAGSGDEIDISSSSEAEAGSDEGESSIPAQPSADVE